MIPAQSLIEKYNKQLPRYTSYPPANYFTTMSNARYVEAVEKSNNTNPSNISFYIHIPFCPQLCWYCGCNTTVCSSLSVIENYVTSVLHEMDTILALLNKTRVVTQIHFGGGSPTSLSIIQLQKFLSKITSQFQLSPLAEIAIECNPADIDTQYVEQLLEIGFNRISLGIQDFNEHVLQSVHRKVSTIPIADFITTIHNHSAFVNLDFIYGLPGQTVHGFEKTIEKALALAPDRIVTFSYAHIPTIKTHQKKIESFTFPSAEEKLHMIANTIAQCTKESYTAIGLDHFAKQTDTLSIAVQNKNLHRNFQGYCTRETTGQVYAFGASAIHQLSGSFFQNSRNIQTYQSLIAQQSLAIENGYELSKHETITATIISSILCNEELDWYKIATECAIPIEDLQSMYAWNKSEIEQFENDNIIQSTSQGFTVLPLGKFFLRNIAAAFDPQIAGTTKTFSKTI